jgi:transposase-like protein
MYTGTGEETQNGRPSPLTSVPERARVQALERFRLLRPHLEEGVPLPQLARQRGLALRAVQRWVQRYRQYGLTLHPDDFSEAEAMAASIRITVGNFRPLERLFSQIERILQINELDTVTKQVVETARESLVAGQV